MHIDKFDFSGKKVIIRVDFNVPLNDRFEITDDTRIKAAIPTIKKILNENGSVIIMSHLGRPKNGPEDKFSLRHILSHLSQLLDTKVKFASDCIGKDAVSISANLKSGEVLLLENLRFYKEETNGDIGFAKELASLAHVYVNDAFGTAHRAHASTAIIAKFFPNNKMFGYVIENELNSIDKVLNNSTGTITAILGGAKVSSKITIIEKLMEKVDNIIIGGGMTFTFIKAMGGSIGGSLVENDKLELALKVLETAKTNNTNIYLPVDAVIADNFDNNANKKTVDVDKIDDKWLGLDIGPKSVEIFSDVILESNIILWNGPMGVFEMSNFENGTKEIAMTLVEATKKGAFTLIGGGDSVAAINKYNLANKVSYVSTGGGALLEYIEGKELPGIKAIKG